MPGINSNTKLMLHGNGTNGSTSIPDTSPSLHSITTNGNTQIRTDTLKFGSGSILFDGSGDYLNIADSTDWDILENNVDDWTIDFWLKHNTPNAAGAQYVISQTFNTSLSAWHLLYQNGTWEFFVGGTSLDFAGSVTKDTNWHHITFVKKANEFGLYFDGVQFAYKLDNTTLNASHELIIGKRWDATSYFNGYLDEVRIQKENYFNLSPNSGLTDTFTVPTEEYTNFDPPTVRPRLLLHCDGTDASTTFTDSSPIVKTVTPSGNAQLDTADVYFGTASGLFDGSGDYLTVTNHSDFDFGTGDFTIDLRFKATTISSFRYLFHKRSGSGSKELEIRIGSGSGDGKIYFQTNNGTSVSITTAFAISINTWYHLAIVRVGTILALYLNGVQVGYASNTIQDMTSTSNLFIATSTAASNSFAGWLDEVRINRDNVFDAAPNVGLTDTIIVPSASYPNTFVPNVPQNLTAATQSDDEILLDWDAPSDDGGSAITGYKIERESPIGGGFLVLVADTGNTNTTYSDTGLTHNTQYNYRVSAINAIGTGSASNEDADLTDPIVPFAPTNLDAVAFSGSQIDLSWDAPSDDGGSAITGYKIERESPIGGGFSVLVADTGNTNTTYSDTGLTHNTQYNYRVSAINAIGTGAASGEANETTLATVPFAPQNLTATTQSSEEILLDWDVPLDDGGSAITGYKIYVESPIGSGFIVLVENTMSTTTTYLDTALTGNTQYNYKVRAINAIGVGQYSNEANATTLPSEKIIVNTFDGKFDILKNIIGNIYRSILSGKTKTKINDNTFSRH